MNTFEKIYDAVRKIPRGKVCTYGQIAAMAGEELQIEELQPSWSPED